MSTPIRPARQRPVATTARRDRAGQFTRKPAPAEAAVAAPADFPPLKKARLTMPEPDFERLRMLKARLKELDRPARKNELLRAGLHALALHSDEALLLALEQLPPAKPPKAPKPAKSARPGKPGATARTRKPRIAVDD